MKIFVILLITIVLPSSTSFAFDNLKKEKKALTETIKNEYNSWSSNPEHTFPNEKLIKAESSHKMGELVSSEKSSNGDAEKRQVKHIKHVPMVPHRFRDFEFTIVNNQAVVQFKVDHELVSAFLEKDNGKWKLVCAAKLAPPS